MLPLRTCPFTLKIPRPTTLHSKVAVSFGKITFMAVGFLMNRASAWIREVARMHFIFQNITHLIMYSNALKTVIQLKLRSDVSSLQEK